MRKPQRKKTFNSSTTAIGSSRVPRAYTCSSDDTVYSLSIAADSIDPELA